MRTLVEVLRAYSASYTSVARTSIGQLRVQMNEPTSSMCGLFNSGFVCGEVGDLPVDRAALVEIRLSRWQRLRSIHSNQLSNRTQPHQICILHSPFLNQPGWCSGKRQVPMSA